MPFIAITRLRVRAWKYLPGFFAQTIRAANQARTADGNLSVSVLRDAHRTFWTRTAWEGEGAMRTYLSSGPHRGVMRSLANWCDEASVVHWMQASSELPSWEDAHQRMQQEGRPSRVDNPTEAHRAYVIPVPRFRRAELPKAK